MRWQTTAALAVILIALGAFYYVYEIRLGPEREKTEGRKGRVFTVEPADVAEVEPNDALTNAQTVAFPLVINGRIGAARDVDLVVGHAGGGFRAR